jgi:hypothetical protein
MPAQEKIITRVPIPGHLPRKVVLEALHSYEPLIVGNPYVERYERRPVPIEDLVGDPFFSNDGQRLQAFTVYDRVPIIPHVGSWATKTIRVPCVFQSFEHGTRCRADAQAGVTVRSSYEVRRRREIPGWDEVTEAQEAAVAGDFELVEIAMVECGSLVKHFVKRSFASAHQAILQRVVDEIDQSYLKSEAA